MTGLHAKFAAAALFFIVIVACSRITVATARAADEGTGAAVAESVPAGLPQQGKLIFDNTPRYARQYVGNKLSCNDCHDPHRSVEFDTFEGVNQVCLSCHPQMAGPFVFEHQPVNGESCTECHLPHGSHNDKLLTQDGNGLCLQCHYEVTFNADDNFELGGVNHGGLLQGEARCYDCHIEVHGSNVSPYFLDQ